jgi:hypothetical protein
MRSIIFRSAIIAFIFLTFGVSTVNAQANIFKVQSLFLYNFVKNIKWENIDQEFVIGVYGNTTAYNEVNASLNSKNVNGVKFRIVNVNSVDDAKKCQLLYLPKSNRSKLVDLLSEASQPNMLIVTEENMISEGASISFEMKDSKLNFIINKQKIEENGLKVSSALMAMGTVAS